MVNILWLQEADAQSASCDGGTRVDHAPGTSTAYDQGGLAFPTTWSDTVLLG